MKKQLIISLALIAALALTACGPSEAELQSTAAAVQTGAANTVAAQFTQNALLTPSATTTPTPSNTPTVTMTATAGTPSTTPTTGSSGGTGGTGGSGGTAGGGCDAMAFVSDVTVPDGSDYAAGATFTKTWQVRNSATCTWSTSYSVVFVSGNQMGATSPQALTASVAPGSTLDISVNMTAPSTNGSYTGYWALRNASGENFGSFYVQIDVTSGGTSGGSGSGTPVALSTIGTGHWTSADTTNPAGTTIDAGDNSSDQTLKGFFIFDLSSIPTGATITSVTLSYGAQDNNGPFALGTLSLISTGTGTSYTGGTSIASFTSTGQAGSSVSNDALKTAVQNAIGSPLSFRTEFSTASTNNGQANFFRFTSPSLTVTYTP